MSVADAGFLRRWPDEQNSILPGWMPASGVKAAWR
jgi:hypothetical protein